MLLCTLHRVAAFNRSAARGFFVGVRSVFSSPHRAIAAAIAARTRRCERFLAPIFSVLCKVAPSGAARSV